MATDHIDVRYVAGLSRLSLSEEETQIFQRQLDSILAHVESLNVLDVSGIEPTAHPAPVYDVLRADEPKASFTAAEVLSNAPDQAQEQIRVPKVIADA
jgi:aspartyl-tRNA(Asn)/glutamyl-tRNA(Gln) amidotransferase subunit C